MNLLPATRTLLVGLAALAVLSAAFGYGSMRYQAGYAKGAARTADAMAEAQKSDSALMATRKTLDDLRAAVAADRSALAAQSEKAQAVSLQAAQSAAQANADAAAWRKRFEDAQRTPSCKAQMEARLCGITSF